MGFATTRDGIRAVNPAIVNWVAGIALQLNVPTTTFLNFRLHFDCGVVWIEQHKAL